MVVLPITVVRGLGQPHVMPSAYLQTSKMERISEVLAPVYLAGLKELGWRVRISRSFEAYQARQ